MFTPTLRSLLLFILFIAPAVLGFSQAPSPENPDKKAISLVIKNTGLWPQKISLIGYAPGETGNSTVAYYLMPGGTKTLSYPVGTRLYKVNQKQVDYVMGGQSIAKDSPFYVVKATDHKKIITF